MGLRLDPDLERKVLELAGQPAGPVVYFEPDVSEAAFMAEVRKLATAHGWTSYHTRDSRKSDKGFPDLALVRPPRLIFAELKVGRNQPTQEQGEWLDRLRACGIPAYLWRPEDWPRIVEVLTG